MLNFEWREKVLFQSILQSTFLPNCIHLRVLHNREPKRALSESSAVKYANTFASKYERRIDELPIDV